MKAEINGFSFEVEEHGFWPHFNTVWEMDTKLLYAKYTFPDKTIIDIGTWIGPTVLIGYANNAKHIYAIEADPVNAFILNKNCRRNHIEDRVTIINRCIYPVSNEIILFGECINNGDTSTKSLGGNTKVLSATLTDIIKENNIEISDVSLVKIDIEGSELFLIRDLKKLSVYKNFVILLSLHQQFWHRIPAKPEALQVLFECYDFFASDETPIAQENIASYINNRTGCLLVLKPKAL